MDVLRIKYVKLKATWRLNQQTLSDRDLDLTWYQSSCPVGTDLNSNAMENATDLTIWDQNLSHVELPMIPTIPTIATIGDSNDCNYWGFQRLQLLGWSCARASWRRLNQNKFVLYLHDLAEETRSQAEGTKVPCLLGHNLVEELHWSMEWRSNLVKLALIEHWLSEHPMKCVRNLVIESTSNLALDFQRFGWRRAA